MIYQDVLALQSPFSAGRGIGRYVLETAVELERRWPGLVASYVTTSSLPRRPSMDRLDVGDRLVPREAISSAPSVFHVTSPFELQVELADLLPWWARGHRTRVVATLYDLIPLRFPHWYPGALTPTFRHRVELVRQADHVVTLSASAKQDAVELLGLRADRITVVGAGVADRFRPRPQDAADASLPVGIPGLREGYCLFTGGNDQRKNIEGLMRAHAMLPPAVRAAHQLVVVCALTRSERDRFLRVAGEAGLRGDEVVFPGHVPDDVLIELYRSARLFVFPSLYEGFGLPVAEALACGTPAVVARNSALVELVDDESLLFDAEDVEEMTAVLRRSLEHPPPVLSLSDDHRWSAVADRLAAVYDLVARTRPPRMPSRPLVAYVSPMPPAPSGVADYSHRMVEALLAFADVDVFTDGPEQRHMRAPSGAHVASASEFEWWETVRGPYDEIFCCLGNSLHHVGALRIARARPATVVLHDVDLRALTGEPEVAHDVVRHAPVVLVHSEHARALVDPRANVRVIPMAAPPGVPSTERDPSVPTVVSLGIAAAVKQSEKVAAAFAILSRRHPDWVLAVVGEVMARFDEPLAAAVGGTTVMLTGRVSGHEYERWVRRAHVAVQLRSESRGETSAAVLDCLAAGVATIVSRGGSSDELPEGSVLKVDRHIAAADLAQVIEELVLDEPRRLGLVSAAAAHARTRSFDVAAVRYVELIGSGPVSPVTARHLPPPS